MTIIDAVMLGIIQALGEFLPISSSAHLVLYSFFTGGVYQGLTFDVALHFATLIAVIIYFWKDLFKITQAGLCSPKSENGQLFWFIGLATIPAALVGFLLKDAAENTFRNPLLIAGALVIFATLLMFADRIYTKKMKYKETFALTPMMIIGCAQALAVIPGVSRSGITITAALLLGFSRPQSAKISFLLSVPIIAGAAALKLKDISYADINAAFAAGFFTALIGGWLVIKFLMKYIQTHTFDLFVCYRWFLGAIIIGLYLLRG